MNEQIGRISQTLHLQKSWYQIRHILADYILNPVSTLVFAQVGANPKAIKHVHYCSIVDKSFRADEKEQKILYKRINSMKNEWHIYFPEAVVNIFFQRLMGTQRDLEAYHERMKKYGSFFLDLIGDESTPGNFRNTTHEYLLMLKDYILRNCPNLPEDKDLDLLDLMKLVREKYTDNPSLVGNIHFEKNIYSQGILELLDDIASSWETNPICNYFLITTEYLYGLFIYVYMIEHILYTQKAEYNLIKYLQGIQFKTE